MKDGCGRRVDTIGLAQREVFVDGGVEGAALDEGANLGHFRGGEHGGNSAVHVASLFPLFLILKEGLFHGLNLAELCSGASVARRNPRVRVHSKRKSAVDQVELAAADVIVHQPAIGGGKESLASWTLVVAQEFHGDRRVL